MFSVKEGSPRFWPKFQFRSLQVQFRAIFLGFLLLIGGSVAATFLAVQAQADDATVINLAGRQRMLTQKMTWLALTQPDNPDLGASIQLFDQTLRALQDGGPTFDSTGRIVTLPSPPDAALRRQLAEVAQTWTTLRAHLQTVDAEALQVEAPSILDQLDAVVSGLATRAQAKLFRLQLIQLISFAAGLLILAWGHYITQRHIVQPIEILRMAAHRIEQGHLADPMPSMREDELGELGSFIETVRAEIATTRDALESRVAQRTHELALAFEFSQEIVAQLDLRHLLYSVTDRARALTGASTASLCLLDETGKTLVLAASSGNIARPAGLQQRVRQGLTKEVVVAGQTVVTETPCSGCSFLGALSPGQCAVTPLRIGTTTIGGLCVVRNAGKSFDADMTRALTLLANTAAIAIANARLAEAQRHQAGKAAALAERERLAAELHDHLAQTLSFLNLKVDQVSKLLVEGCSVEAQEELARINVAMDMANRQVRTALAGLHDSTPITEDLAQKLAACLEDFRETSGLVTELAIVGPTPLALSPLVQNQVLHIVREALINVRKHARAQRVRVCVEVADDCAWFTIEDDGCGFDPQAVKGGHHLGLAIMRARAERSGGSLLVHSVPGAGTKVVVCFPLDASERQTTHGVNEEKAE